VQFQIKMFKTILPGLFAAKQRRIVVKSHPAGHKMKKNILILVSALALTWSFNTAAAGLMSDDFEREYNSSDAAAASYGNLGATKEGYKWLRRDLDKNGPDVHLPGILEYAAGNKGLVWKCPSRTSDMVYLDKKLKDFKLDFDYSRTGEPSFHGVTVNFRMVRPAMAVSDGGHPAGYGLQIMPLTKDSMKVKLLSNYGLAKESAEIYTGKLGGHISIAAQGSNIKIYVGEALALDITDSTDNPARNAEGFFTIQCNQWVNGDHCIDNWYVTTIK